MSKENQNSVSKSKRIEVPFIVGIVLIAIFLPIICVNMTLVIKGWVHPDQVPMVFNRSVLFVKSDSMAINKDDSEDILYRGAFNKDDLIFIKKVDPEELEINDIITYKEIDDDGNLVLITHRIRAIEENPDKPGEKLFITAGDTLNPGTIYQPDPDPVSYDMVVGEYTGRIVKLGKVADFLQSWQGIVILIGVPAIIVVVVELVIRNNKKNSFEKDQELERLNKELEELRKKEAEKQQDEAEEQSEKSEETSD